jgi:hypothetical protein
VGKRPLLGVGGVGVFLSLVEDSQESVIFLQLGAQTIELRAPLMDLAVQVGKLLSKQSQFAAA